MESVFIITAACLTLVNSLPIDNMMTNLAYLPLSASDKVEQLLNSKSLNIFPEFPDSGRTYASPEQESFFSKKDSTYSKAQQVVAHVYHPKPIVDTISEEEKYGNDGDKFRSVGTIVVSGLEHLSNIVNTAVEIPVELVKQAGKNISDNFSSVGRKLVGL